jgi:MFS family permease
VSRDVNQSLYTRSLFLAFLSQAFFVLANTLLTHYARWIGRLGGDERDIGWIMGIGPIVGLVARLWMGPLIDRLGSRLTQGLGYGLFAISALANLSVHDVSWVLYVLRTLTVLGSALFFASNLTYVTQIAPAGRQTEGIGFVGAGGFLGIMLGPWLGDWILGDVHASAQQFHWLFAAAAISMLPPAIVLAFLDPPPRSHEAKPLRIGQFLSSVRLHWPGVIMLVTLTFGVCMTVPFVFLSKYLERIGLAIGPFFFVYAGWGLVLRIGLRRAPEQWGRHRVLIAGMIAMGLGILSFQFVEPTSSWWLALPAFLCGTGHSLMFHTMVGLAIEPFPLDLRGTGTVLALLSVDIGQVAGPPILGEVAYYLDYDALYMAVGLAMLSTACIYAWRVGWPGALAPVSPIAAPAEVETVSPGSAYVLPEEAAEL